LIVRTGFAIDGEIDPAWSPCNRDLTGLPPTLIQVGAYEMVFPDSEHMAAKLAEAGVVCILQKWDRQPHVFQNFADILPDARAAINEIAAFNRQILNGEL
jgi:acetyl esterase/lipase